jgi:hypothetical protein
VSYLPLAFSSFYAYNQTSEPAIVITGACPEDLSTPFATMIETDTATDDIPSTISTPATQIPSAITATELLRQIIENIQDKPTLAVCTRVSNKFYHITAPYLYERIDLDNTGSKLFLGCPKGKTVNAKAKVKRNSSSRTIFKGYLLEMTKVITVSCSGTDAFLLKVEQCTAHLPNLKTLRVIERPACDLFEGIDVLAFSHSDSLPFFTEYQQCIPKSVTKTVLDFQHKDYVNGIGSYARFRRRDWLLGTAVATVVAIIRLNEFRTGSDCLMDPWGGKASGTIPTITIFLVGFDGILGPKYNDLVWWLVPLVAVACGDSGCSVRVYLIPDEHSISAEKSLTDMQSAWERHLKEDIGPLPDTIKVTFKTRAAYLAEGIDDEIDPAELSEWRYQEIKLRARLSTPGDDHTEQYEPGTKGAGDVTS